MRPNREAGPVFEDFEANFRIKVGHGDDKCVCVDNTAGVSNA